MREGTRKVTIMILIVLSIVGGHYLYTKHFVQKGLYHYIREGRRLLDEERYERAFAAFKRANSFRPESERLLQNIFHGYTSYANHLVSHRRFDEAVEVLKELYSDYPEQETVIYQLSSFQARKAINAMLSGQEDRAALLMAEAVSRALNSDSNRLRYSLSNYLFNRGMRAFKTGQNEVVSFALESSYNLWSRFDTLRFLGQHYYNRNDMERAIFWWEKARVLRPGDIEINAQLDKLGRQIALEEDMRDIETENFNISMYRDYGLDEHELTDILTEVSGKVGRDLDFYPPHRTRIVFYDEKDFREVFDETGVVRAFYDGAIRMHLTETFQTQGLKALIAHEYTHAVISMITGVNCPVWIHEGLAVYQQSRYEPVSLSALKSAIVQGRDISIYEIESNFGNYAELDKLTLSYQAAYSLMRFMIDRWGLSSVRDFLDSLATGKHYANAVDEVYYVTLRSLERMWLDDLREQLKAKRVE